MKKGTPKMQNSRLTTTSKVNNAPKKTIKQSINEEYLKKTLKLLGVVDDKFQKQTKTSLKNELFPKTLPNATTSKQFFYICNFCAKNLISNEQDQQLSMWYPPRTVNEQIQFKKVFFKILQKLQAHGKMPKNVILSKMILMGDGNSQSIIQFLRILAQLSLRALYLQKYSKQQRLIQISVNNGQFNMQNDINKFYVFPFHQTVTNVEPPIKSEVDLQNIKKMFKVHINRYRKKILGLRTVEETQGINPQALMTQIMEQKQLASTLQNKVNKSIYSQNRAFDRRIILDKSQQIWKELMQLPCNYIDQEQTSVLKIEGETAKILSNWRPVSGTPNLIEFNSQSKKISELKKRCSQKLTELKQLKKELLLKIKNVKD